MGEKIRFALQKCKSVLIIVLILWVVLSIVLIAPVTISWVEAVNNNNGGFIDNLLGSDLSNVGANLSKAFSKEYRSFYLKNELYLALGLGFCAIIGFIKTMPKHDYASIEHGSSDWAKGEEYSILSKNKGIILAEKHYLPVDKRGNVNVLVVGRFRFW
jgi:hypothetical protein